MVQLRRQGEHHAETVTREWTAATSVQDAETLAWQALSQQEQDRVVGIQARLVAEPAPAAHPVRRRLVRIAW